MKPPIAFQQHRDTIRQIVDRHFPDFATQNPDFPLKAAYGTRNALTHGYFKVDLDVVWKTIERDLALLEVQVRDVIHALYHRGPSPSL
ncbi:DUF86 domain-containing protein [Sedimenticola hydrogenitrophicus]|uniref:HepT-like ribonuclease domain-containing protein n=1 Tax=Sedimenticola hydrogenitrophicus TaxID=2967975 RepID=UPI0023B00281|nr:HepT-like ribonuclease domain-containing protein [Sedimenticola hydrogenitrophicus]